MGEIFRELQEESKEHETRTAFERWLTEKRGTPLLLEQTQAYEAFKAGMKHYGRMTAVRMFQAEEAVLAKPETAEPVAWLHHAQVGDGGDGRALSFSPDYYQSMGSRPVGIVRESIAVVPLYTHPPRDIEPPTEETKP